MPKEYTGELIDVSENLFALKKDESIMIFDTEIYDIFDENKQCEIISVCFGENL